MTKTYRIFDLYVESAIALPAVAVDGPPKGLAPQVVVARGDVPERLKAPVYEGVRFQAGAGEFLLRVDGVARYHVRDGRHIVVAPEPGAAEEAVLVFLMGSAFGALLHQRRILVLHAGAVAAGGGSILFTGRSGIGKSTLAAGFHRRGYPFLADDVCAVAAADGQPIVVPGFPRLKLWADALRKMDRNLAGLEKVRWIHGLEKYFLPVEDQLPSPAPVRAVFVLEVSGADQVEIAALKGQAKVPPLMGHTYRPHFLKGLGGKREHFRQCAAVADRAQVYRVARPKSGFELEALLDLLEARFP